MTLRFLPQGVENGYDSPVPAPFERPVQRGGASSTGRPRVTACRADLWKQAAHTRPLTHRDLGARARPPLSMGNLMASFLKRTRGGGGYCDVGWASGLLPQVMAWKVLPLSFPPSTQQAICGVPTLCLAYTSH